MDNLISYVPIMLKLQIIFFPSAYLKIPIRFLLHIPDIASNTNTIHILA